MRPNWLLAAALVLALALAGTSVCRSTIVGIGEALRRALLPCGRANETAATAAGGLGAVFVNAAKDFPELSPRVLSRDPWIVAFQEFASDAEMDGILAAARAQTRGDFVQSLMDDEDGDVVRSSQHLWCDTPTCMQDADVVRLMSRLSTVTRTPAANAEVLQLLRYDEGQRYDVHNDYTGGGHDGASGGRLFSFVLFLSSPEEGGELHFADVNLTIRAERGAAVLWPSLSAQDFDLPELLSHHASVPVRRGQKLAAVTWLHLYDWRTLQLDRGCAESLGAIIPPFALLPRYLAAREAAGLERIVPSSMIAQAQRAQRQAQARREAHNV